MKRKLDQPSKETCDIVDNRDGHSCFRCGISLYATYGARHHRKMRSHAFGAEKHSVSNLIDLCETCHGWFHAHPAEAYRLGYMVHMGDNPASTPMLRYDGKWVLLDNEGGEKIETA